MTSTTKGPTMNTQIEAWINKLTQDVERNSAEKWKDCEPNHSTITFTKGPKYYKVSTRNKHNSSGGSAYCFIDMQGNIYMAASWKAPAKGIRGNIIDVNTDNFDGGTGWLYRR